MFTTGIVVKKAEHTLTLFFSGRRHAGENLQALLDRRSIALDVPIQMCDGLDRNVPGTTPTLPANCNTHGRRGFVEVADAFPEECAYVLETIQQIYACDQQAKTQHLSPEQRLALHQRISGPLMDKLKRWMERKLEAQEVEPNSNLGEALRYELKHWKTLTLFLRVPAAPLDNNLCERALKMAIQHRTNSLFYKTEQGAHVGDLFMSLIHTCRLSRINPFDYLTTLGKYAHKLRDGPAAWMPWNYQATVAALAQPRLGRPFVILSSRCHALHEKHLSMLADSLADRPARAGPIRVHPAPPTKKMATHTHRRDTDKPSIACAISCHLMAASVSIGDNLTTLSNRRNKARYPMSNPYWWRRSSAYTPCNPH